MDAADSPQKTVRTTALHAAILASFAASQPLLDVLGRAPDFLLAHDLRPVDILAVAISVGVLIPAAIWLLVAGAGALHRYAGFAVGTLLLGTCVALIALGAMRPWESVGEWPPIAIAAVLALGVTVLYWRSQGVRRFMTWLTPGIVLFPLIFVARPGVWSLIWPRDAALAASVTLRTPVVMIVFDSLPLTALLDEHRTIDRRLYPSFAAFADEATWYRNTTTVSDYTRWALPAMITGRYPTPSGLPTSSHHPESLFTLIGSSQDLHVYEPITRLCPSRLCDHESENPSRKLSDFAEILSTVYLHRVLPAAFEPRLPAVDPGWADGVPPGSPGELWLEEGEEGRRSTLLAFIESMKAGATPASYFIHVLLPHTPIAYFPSGQRFTSERFLPGLLEGRDRWVGDEWPVLQGYRLFLLQVGYVDAVLGRVVDQLKAIGLYDRALVVVTSDHGAAFRPGQAFRRVSDETVVDIVPVPLLIKEPGQRAGAVTDRNVETVDILPTIADLLDVEVPWKTDGISATTPAAPAGRTQKVVYFDDARRTRTFGPSLLDDVYKAVDRKLALFGSSLTNPYHIPVASPAHDLIGRALTTLPIAEGPGEVDFRLDSRASFANIDTRSLFLPARLTGFARRQGSDDPVVLAVSVNGTIHATTQTYVFNDRNSQGTWSVVLNPDAFRQGANEVEVFIVETERGSRTLSRAYRSPPG